jgi:ATP-binding cassette subfamily B protein
MLMLGGMVGPIAAADASASRIWEVLDSNADVQDHPRVQATGVIKGRVAFEDVCFSYNGPKPGAVSPGSSPTGHLSGRDEPVLTGINLVAEPGQTVAILGATGSGKSSLIHLIPRFYDVDRGRITLDGVDVRDLPLDLLRAQRMKRSLRQPRRPKLTSLSQPCPKVTILCLVSEASTSPEVRGSVSPLLARCWSGPGS